MHTRSPRRNISDVGRTFPDVTGIISSFRCICQNWMCLALTWLCCHDFKQIWGRSVGEKTSKWLTVEALSLDLEDLKQSQLAVGGGWGGVERQKVVLLSERAYWVHQFPPPTPHPTPSPRTESDVWPTMPSKEQRGYQKSDPGGDHYYAGRLGQTRISLPEYLISDQRHIMVRGYQPSTSEGW